VTISEFLLANFVTKTRKQVLKPARFPENSQVLDQKSTLGWGGGEGLGRHLEPPPPRQGILLFTSFSLVDGDLYCLQSVPLDALFLFDLHAAILGWLLSDVQTKKQHPGTEAFHMKITFYN
jgi:hypothetical protein